MMQLFRKIFNPFARPEQSYPIVLQEETVATSGKTLTSMFRLDLNHLPLQDFNEGKIEVNANGEFIQTYFKALDYKECGIFDRVQVKLTDNKSINIIFRCSEPELVDDNKLHKVIDDLYSIYGQGNNSSELYSTPVSNNPDQQFYILFGRDWMDYPKYKYPVSLRRYTKDVFISIWGFRLQ